MVEIYYVDDLDILTSVLIDFGNGIKIFEKGIEADEDSEPDVVFKGLSTQKIYSRKELEEAKIFNVNFAVAMSFYTKLTPEEVLKRYLSASEEERELWRKLESLSVDMHLLISKMGI